ncbi:AbrB/MazE/SpoVT family DNA-binding domain-containing protein [Limosilactobacillus ingluviei]|uniref:AbrB/MazE/SpoVT family DNA-binding domain-containing protein n=1 Tax=Limosilactobacillus ingluviei TaxID=148604 RepID=UPI00031AB850|nr:hypothetical protein [Limosilactobacillus ingluviei]
MVLKMPTKIFKSGNSSAVRLNKDIMHAAGLKINDPIEVTFNEQDGSVVIKPMPSQGQIDDQFLALLKQSMNEDQATLEFLKDK